ncbi:MAG: hypothetical protein ABH879_09635 [archaeon]
MICKSCKGRKIKTRSNYTHGKKSRVTMVRVCKACGSQDIEVEVERKRRR